MPYLHTIDGDGVARPGNTRQFGIEAGDALAITCSDVQPLRAERRGPASRFLIFEFPPGVG